MNNYIIVLGSNLSSEFGSSAETLKKCVGELKSFQPIQSLLESKWYISSSFVDKSEPRYVNVGIRLSTNLKPKELLNFTASLEIKYGRKRQTRWEPRTCDIDILLCVHQVITLSVQKNLISTISQNIICLAELIDRIVKYQYHRSLVPNVFAVFFHI